MSYSSFEEPENNIKKFLQASLREVSQWISELISLMWGLKVAVAVALKTIHLPFLCFLTAGLALLSAN